QRPELWSRVNRKITQTISVQGFMAMLRREKVEKARRVEDNAGNALVRGFRMAPMSATQPIEVSFPADCDQLRVRAYYYGWREDGKGWKHFKNEVYSILGSPARDEKMAFVVRASISDLEGGEETTSVGDVPVIQYDPTDPWGNNNTTSRSNAASGIPADPWQSRSRSWSEEDGEDTWN
ncbi:unnamed protein product, partial [Laminaria digitata]